MEKLLNGSMKKSHLTTFAEKRSLSLKEVDQKDFPESKLKENELRCDRPKDMSSFLRRKDDQKPHVLFEVKKASPSLGQITSINAVDLCSRFIEQKARAISVLVDPVNFGGHPQDLADCVESFPKLPFLWKDFVLGEYQIRLAKSLGASSILLMTQLLEDEVLKDLFQFCQSMSIEPFVETHSHEELEFALGLGATMIGINARDFKTPGLPIDLATAGNSIAILDMQWPKECVLIAQSGIATYQDLHEVLSSLPMGLPDAVQIGSSVSGRAELPSDLIAALEL